MIGLECLVQDRHAKVIIAFFAKNRYDYAGKLPPYRGITLTSLQPISPMAYGPSEIPISVRTSGDL